MDKSSYPIITLLALAFGHYLLSSFALAADKVYMMRGEITAIERTSNEVAIVAQDKNNKFRLNATISPNGVLKKSRKGVSLGDFLIGDKVTVQWRTTDTGHFIVALKSR
jgi:hypothetical protein